MIESSIVKEVFLPDRGSCLCGKHFNDLTNSFRIGFRKSGARDWRETKIPESMAEKIQFRGVSKHYPGKYISSKETWFRIHHSVHDGLGG